jgi:phosphate transport system substrate-binding protein
MSASKIFLLRQNPGMKTLAAVTSILLALGSTAAMAQVKQIRGAGATFPYPAYSAWAKAYQAKSGTQLDYQAIGSGGGLKQIQAGLVDFGATDRPLTPADLDANGLTQFPTVIGGAVPIVNVPGIGAGALRLTGKLLADIYLGKVNRWNDPAIQAINPELKLPAMDIGVRHRVDSSGTTFLFTNYLSQVSEEWKKRVGEGTSVSWPIGLGGKGNEGVLLNVKMLPGSIGFVELSYAMTANVPDVLLQNQSGAFVRASRASFTAAAAAATWDAETRFYQILTNQAQADAWPITGASYVLVKTKQADAKTGKALLSFFQFGISAGGREAMRDLTYATLPDTAVIKITEAWSKSVRGPGGAAIWP